MKKILIATTIILSCCLTLTLGTNAQIPNGSDLSIYPSTIQAPLPTGYNQGLNAGVSLADQTTPKLNYRRTWIPQVPVTTLTGFELNGTSHYLANTDYVNGWGNVLQSNLRGGGTIGKDIIKVVDNRALSKSRSFLPFVADKETKFLYGGFLDQRNYYDNTYPAEGGASYSEQYKPDDQGTPTVHNYAPGRAFVGQSVGTTTTTIFNTANEVRLFKMSSTEPYWDGYYAANEIKVVTTVSQHDGMVKEYYNKDGQLIQKSVKATVSNTPIWLNTYYVYNGVGKLQYVIPHKAFNPTWVQSLQISLKECFIYKYNGLGELVNRYIPGFYASTTSMDYERYIYDRKGRQVLFQSPELAPQNKYQFKIYDSRDRVVAEGIVTSTLTEDVWNSEIFNNTSPTTGSLLYYIINGVSGTVTNIPNCDILVYNYYDGNHNSAGFGSGNDFYTGHSQYYRTDAGAVAPQWYKFPNGQLTGSVVRTVDAGNNQLGVGNVTVTQYYYDQKGQLIQTRSALPWYSPVAVKSITTYQYNFAGQKILEVTSHTSPNETLNTNPKPTTLQQTAYYYDINNGGRLLRVEQKMDNEAWRNISTYTYNNLGQVSRKYLGNIETQNYAYDLKGSLRSINKSYTENGQGSYDMPTTFGCKLFFENGFTENRLDGKMAGMIWRGAGNAPMHAYGYQYELSGKLAHAEFREYSNSAYLLFNTSNGPVYGQGMNWNKIFKDYTASKMTYDENGNLLTMNQVGVQAGAAHPTYIDVLKYSYLGGSTGSVNRVTAVTDGVLYDYQLDDFVDRDCELDPWEPGDNAPPLLGSKGEGWQQQYWELGNPPPSPAFTCQDYEYDRNGNLIHDGNKQIDITYNHMNLPVDVTVVNTSGNNGGSPSTIHNVYDGTGTLLQKTIVDNREVSPVTDVYEYIGPFVYKNDVLDYVLHEEGRARYMPAEQLFKYDYFVKDHLGNVRTVVTADPYDGIDYVASHELASANLESSIFAHINQVRSGNPAPSNNNTMAAKLNGAVDSTRIGTALLLQVMPGDQIDLSALYYWESDTSGGAYSHDTTMLSSLLGTLTGGVGGYVGNEGPSAALLGGLLNTANYVDVYSQLVNNQTNTSLPRAYLNYQVFDANMNLIPDKSGAIQIGSTQGQWGSMELTDPILVGQNGYVLVDVSNATFTDVNFDQVHITFYRGNVVQENHYYPYGLCIKYGDGPEEKNNFKYQGKLLQDELDLQLYDFHARQYDPQIGRFWGIDPADQFPSSYTGMGNDPANMIDPTGMKAQVGYGQEVDYMRDLYGPLDQSSRAGSSAQTTYTEDWDYEMDNNLSMEWNEKQDKDETPDNTGTTNDNEESDGGGDGDGKKEKERPNLGPIGNAIRNQLGSNFSQDCFEHFIFGQGTTMVLTPDRFKDIVKEAGGMEPTSEYETTLPNGKPGIARQFSFYGSSEYKNSIGTGTIYYTRGSNVPVGFKDTYNFDTKKWGERPVSGEAKTRVGNYYGVMQGARNYEIQYWKWSHLK